MFKIGDRVKVIDQNISGEIVRWDGAKAVVLTMIVPIGLRKEMTAL